MAEKATLWQFSMLIPLKILSDSENPWFSRLQIHLLLKWFFRVPAGSVTCRDDLLIRRSLHMQPYLLSEITNPDMAREDNPRQSSPRITSEARRIHEARMICHPRRGILDISRPVKMSRFRGRGWVMIPVSRTRLTLPSPRLASPRLVNLDICNVYLTSRHVALRSKPVTY